MKSTTCSKISRIVLAMLILLLPLDSGAVAATHAWTSLPTLTENSNAICIATIVRPVVNGQPDNRLIVGPSWIKIAVASVLKGVISNPIANVHIGPDVYISPETTTAIFFMNGDSVSGWTLTPDYPQPVLPVDKSSKILVSSSTPLFSVVSALCQSLPHLNREDRLEELQRLYDIVPLLSPGSLNPGFARQTAALGGSARVQQFAKTSMYPEIEKFYSDPDSDTRSGFLQLGKDLGDVQATIAIEQKHG